jgi:hypothetical protein
MGTVPARFAQTGDPWAGIDEAEGSLEKLLDLAERNPSSELSEPAGSSFPVTSGRRRTTVPLIEIARAASNAEALAALDRWKRRHPQAAAYLQPADVLVDSMRGRSSTWTRIRVNLRHVPVAQRPQQEALEIDYDPWRPSSESATP